MAKTMEEIVAYRKQYYKDHKEKLSEYRKQYYETHKEQFNEYRKKYREKNRGTEKYREMLRRASSNYRKNNPEKFNAYIKKYREANKEKISEIYRKYKRTHRDKVYEMKVDYYRRAAIGSERHHWDDWEDEMIMEHKLTDKELSKKTKHSVAAIQTRRWKLNKLYGKGETNDNTRISNGDTKAREVLREDTRRGTIRNLLQWFKKRTRSQV